MDSLKIYVPVLSLKIDFASEKDKLIESSMVSLFATIKTETGTQFPHYSNIKLYSYSNEIVNIWEISPLNHQVPNIDSGFNEVENEIQLTLPLTPITNKWLVGSSSESLITVYW